jgi:peptidoglycan/xylan/chitin deacetylase (PgdA/CDA1 family)
MRRVATTGAVAGILALACIPAAAARQPAVTAPAAVAANQAARSAVALVVGSAGTGAAFYRGQGDAVYTRPYHDGTWSAQTSLGGVIVGAPAAAIAGGVTAVATRGTDDAIWVRTSSGGMWGTWQNWGGAVSSSPALAGASNGRLDVFVRGTDGALWSRTRWSNGVLAAWQRLGGALTTGPAAVAFAPGSIQVYAAGTNHQVWRVAFAAGTWSGWTSIGGATYCAPAVAHLPGSTATWVFTRGTDNALYANTGTGGVFGGWRRLGGALIDGPGAAGGPAPGIDVAVRGTDNAVWGTLYRGGTWSGMSRAWVPAPPPVPAGSLLRTDWTRIPTTSKIVALTFDAGANAAGLASIERTLRSKKVTATFTLTGNWVRSFPAEANLITAGGFDVGNHSDTHPYFTSLTDAQVAAEVRDAQHAILVANGADVRPVFRFPYGDVNSRVLADVNAIGYVPVRWTVDSLGWEGTSGGMTVQKVIDRVVGAAQPGEIVLMHIGSNPTDHTTLDASALPTIIDSLRARGYKFVTLSALVGR